MTESIIIPNNGELYWVMTPWFGKPVIAQYQNQHWDRTGKQAGPMFWECFNNTPLKPSETKILGWIQKPSLPTEKITGRSAGELSARCINTNDRPFAVISSTGPVGDQMVASGLVEGDARLFAASPDMLIVLDYIATNDKDSTGLRDGKWAQLVRGVIAKAMGMDIKK